MTDPKDQTPPVVAVEDEPQDEGFGIFYLDENGIHKVGQGPEDLHAFFAAIFGDD